METRRVQLHLFIRFTKYIAREQAETTLQRKRTLVSSSQHITLKATIGSSEFYCGDFDCPVICCFQWARSVCKQHEMNKKRCTAVFQTCNSDPPFWKRFRWSGGFLSFAWQVRERENFFFFFLKLESTERSGSAGWRSGLSWTLNNTIEPSILRCSLEGV